MEFSRILRLRLLLCSENKGNEILNIPAAASGRRPYLKFTFPNSPFLIPNSSPFHCEEGSHPWSPYDADAPGQMIDDHVVGLALYA